MDHKSVDMKWLATELEGKSHETLGDEKVAELIEVFGQLVGNTEITSPGSLESLPGWFLISALGRTWPDIKGKDFLLHQINSQFEKKSYRELKIQIAATISTVDPQSGMHILERMDDKKLRTKGLLPKSYIDSILKYFSSEDSRAFNAIFQCTPSNNRVLKNVAQQFFEVFFGGKSSLALPNKSALQGKLLSWLITHKQYSACAEVFPDAVAKEVLMWPMSMLAEYESIRQAADSAGIPFSALRTLIPKYVPTEEELELSKRKLLRTILDTELLEEMGKRLSGYNGQIEAKNSKISEQSGKISELQSHKDRFSQMVAALEDEKRGLIAQNGSMKNLHAAEVRKFEEELDKYKKQIEAKEHDISELNIKIESIKNATDARIDEIAKRIGIEAEHSKKELTEKIQDLLTQDFNDMNRLGDSENHKAAKIMISHIFNKLNRLGITFNK